jgi:hypothetical protein
MAVDWSTQTQRITAGGASGGQSLKSYVGKVALSASATTTQALETVAAAKTFYLTDIFISHDTAAVIDVQIRAAGVAIFRAPVKGDTAPVQLAGLETQPQAQAGQAVDLFWPITAGPPNAYFMINGYEQ